MKKYLALLLVLVMTLGLFAACGETTPPASEPQGSQPAGTTAPAQTTAPAPKDPVTLVWHVRGNGNQKDNAKVMEEFNKKLQAIPGFEHITIDLRNNMAGEHAATVERVYTAKEQIDIVCTVNLNPLNMSRDGYFVGLSQYFDKYPTLWETFPEWLWETQYVDDDYYVVPNYQRGSNPKIVAMRKADAELCDWEGFCKLMTWKDGHSTGSLKEIFDKVEEMYLDLKAAGRDICMITPISALMAYNQVDFWRESLLQQTLDRSKSQFFVKFSTGEVNSILLTEEFKLCWEYAAKWFDAGYYPDDIELNAAQWTTWNSGKGWLTFDQSAAWEQDAVVANANAIHGEAMGELVAYRYNDYPYMENRWAAGGNAVSTTSEHPEDAVAFLTLLNSKEGTELYNMLVYGLEGVHWEWTDKENEIIRTFEYDSTQGSNAHSHAINKWCIGNTFNAYDNQGCAVGEREIALKINEMGVVSPYAGVKIDATELETEISNCAAVVGEYDASISYGIGGMAAFNEKYPKMVDALKQAGVETVITELQSQIDDYIASRG